MRNLKRVLSLGLATVMLLGMMVLGTSAADKTFADLTDSDQIVNKEAVSVLVDLGIVEGTDTGAYQPTLTVNRATMAKFVYCLLNGVDDEGASFKDLDMNFTDIDTPSSTWAKGYINYCASLGIIAGDGNGHFYPDETVSTAQAAKMLLVALGYNAKTSKYEGDANWAVNVMRDAQRNGIVPRGMLANDGLSRDNTALVVFNTLNAKTVTPNYQYTATGESYVAGYTSNSTTLGYDSYGLIKVTAPVKSIRSSDGTAELGDLTIAGVNGTKSGAASSQNNIKIPATADMVGSNVTFYVKGTLTTSGNTTDAVLDSVYSSTLLPSATNVLSTVYGGTAFVKLTTTGEREFVGAVDVNAKYYLNGVEQISSADVNALQIKVANRGVITELIDNDNDSDIDIVRVTEKRVGTVSNDPSTQTTTNGTEQIRIPGVVASWTNTDKVVLAEDVQKDDVVLYYTSAGITYIEKAASIEGVVTSVRNNQPGVDGTYYNVSQLPSASNSWTGTNDFTNTYVFYLDNNNNVIKAVRQTNEASSNNYAYVVQTAWVAGTGAIGQSTYAQAQIVKAGGNGEAEIVTVSTVNGNKIVADTATAGANEVKYSGAITSGNIYQYSENNDGTYSLTSVTNAAFTGATVTSGNANFTTGQVGNANTVFIYATGTNDAPVYTIYNGISEIPSISGLTPSNCKVVNVNSVAACVYVDAIGKAFSGEVGEYIYVQSKTNPVGVVEDGRLAYYQLTAIVNGERETIKVDSAALATINEKTLYVVSGKANDVISGVTAATPIKESVTISGNVLVCGDPSVSDSDPAADIAVTLNDDTAIYYISTTGSVDTLAYDGQFSDTTDKVFVEKDNNNVATQVYIMQVTETDASLTNVKYKVNSGAETNLAISDDNTNIPYSTTNSVGAVVTIGELTISSGATYTISSSTATVQAKTGSDVVITIVVTSEDGKTSKTYTVTVKREPSEAAELTSVADGSTAVSETSTNNKAYAIGVSASALTDAAMDKTINLTASSGAKISVTAGTKTAGDIKTAWNGGDNNTGSVVVTLNEGATATQSLVLNVTVTAENGSTTADYTITITVQ